MSRKMTLKTKQERKNTPTLCQTQLKCASKDTAWKPLSTADRHLCNTIDVDQSFSLSCHHSIKWWVLCSQLYKADIPLVKFLFENTLSKGYKWMYITCFKPRPRASVRGISSHDSSSILSRCWRTLNDAFNPQCLLLTVKHCSLAVIVGAASTGDH